MVREDEDIRPIIGKIILIIIFALILNGFWCLNLEKKAEAKAMCEVWDLESKDARFGSSGYWNEVILICGEMRLSCTYEYDCAKHNEFGRCVNDDWMLRCRNPDGINPGWSINENYWIFIQHYI